jgi:single-stranded DNA-binding protein
LPELDEEDHEIINQFTVDGRICNIDDEIRVLNKGKQNIHFILANNMIVDNDKQKLNSYLPCIAWGNMAKQVSQLKVND